MDDANFLTTVAELAAALRMRAFFARGKDHQMQLCYVASVLERHLAESSSQRSRNSGRIPGAHVDLVA